MTVNFNQLTFEFYKKPRLSSLLVPSRKQRYSGNLYLNNDLTLGFGLEPEFDEKILKKRAKGRPKKGASDIKMQLPKRPKGRPKRISQEERAAMEEAFRSSLEEKSKTFIVPFSSGESSSKETEENINTENDAQNTEGSETFTSEEENISDDTTSNIDEIPNEGNMIKNPFSDPHNRPLKGFTFAQFRDSILNLETGKYIGEGNKQSPIPIPFMKLNKVARKRYYLMYAVLQRRLGANFSRDRNKGYLLEACLFHIDTTKFDNECPCPLITDVFISGLESIAYDILKTFPYFSNLILFKSNTLQEMSMYLYTPGKTHYAELSEIQALKFVKGFLEHLFCKTIPEGFNNTAFLIKLKTFMAIELSICHEEFIRKHEKSGVPFNNFFVQILDGEPGLIKVPYSSKIFNLRPPIPIDYEDPIFQGDQIILSKAVYCFLSVICKNSTYHYNVIRGFLRNCLTANIDGTFWQSCLWVWGPPATGKSLLVQLVKAIVGENYVQEFSRHQNQFSNIGLDSAKVLIVSDLEIITPIQKEILKAIMGRDLITIERKYQNVKLVVNPKCQVIFVSNKSPNAVGEFISDAAIMDKLIVLEYTEQDRIPVENQIADLKFRLSSLLGEIYNWVMYSPAELLQYHVRAINYGEYARYQGAEKQTMKGYPAFIESCLAYKEKGFVPIETIKNLMVQYSKNTGDDTDIFTDKFSNGIRIRNTERGQMLSISCREIFNDYCYYGRSKSIETENGVSKSRPYGMFNMVLKSQLPTDPNTSTCHYFKTKIKKPEKELPAPFYSDRRINWVNTDYAQILEISEDILKSRERKAEQAQHENENQSGL